VHTLSDFRHRLTEARIPVRRDGKATERHFAFGSLRIVGRTKSPSAGPMSLSNGVGDANPIPIEVAVIPQLAARFGQRMQEQSARCFGLSVEAHQWST
jgi:hypothetical protein